MRDSEPRTPRLDRAVDGPVERWLKDAVERRLAAALPEVGIRVSEVILCEGARPGDFRVLVTWPDRATPTKSEWKQVAAAVAAAPDVDKAVSVPPAVYVTLAPGVIDEVLARPPTPRDSVQEPGIVLVFCSPNTNKPLHIGHLRACFLGMSMSRMVEATGIAVRRSQMLSNFGVHMCQALTMYDGVETPESAGLKPDWFVGELYRRYHAAVAELGGPECDGTSCQAPCLRCLPLASLRRMVDGDGELSATNRRLGEWAIEGILATQARIGASYDSGLRESEVLGVALDAIMRALDAGVCQRRDDGSIYVDIRTTGEAQLTLLRQNGTSLVYSMLLGIYLSRTDRYRGWNTIELTGEQWRAGRRAMYELLERIGRTDISSTTEGVFFGMVQLGDTVMSSRRGNVVLADELLDRIAARVRACERVEPHVRASAAASDALAIALLKYYVLGQPRGEGFCFDEDLMWADVIERALAVRALLLDAGVARAARSAPATLALALARHASIHKRALQRRDPAIVVRYIDDLVKLASPAAKRDELGRDAGRAVVRVVRAALALLDIDPDAIAPP